MDSINWGIIGCGNVCEKKAGPALYGVEHSRLVAVMRRNGELAADFARRHDVPRHYDRIEDLLADGEVNAVYIATPDAAHHAATLAAVAAGKPVLVEKAMASNTAQCDEMIAAATQRGVVLAVAYYRRAYPSILRARALIDDGAIGPVREVHINDEFPLSHRLDLCHFFCGDARAVRATDGPLPPCSHAAQGAMLEVHHEGGAVCWTPAGWRENLVAETLDIRGGAGRIVIHDLKQGVMVIERHGQDPVREEPGPLPATHWGLVDNFVRHLREGAPLACDGVEGRKSTVILDIVDQLRPDGREIAVRY